MGCGEFIVKYVLFFANLFFAVSDIILIVNYLLLITTGRYSCLSRYLTIYSALE